LCFNCTFANKIKIKTSMTLFKSINAVVIGFLFVVCSSIAMDLLLMQTGIMKQPFNENSTVFILFVTLYRNVFSTIGTYLTARFSPNKPMGHAMISGIIGLLLSIAGAITMWHVPPHWYAISLIFTALPSAWLGGKIFVNSKK
jgi:hypothetical protein